MTNAETLAPPTDSPTTHRWPPVLAVALATFTVVSSETMPVGPLTPMSHSLGVSDGTTGHRDQHDVVQDRGPHHRPEPVPGVEGLPEDATLALALQALALIPYARAAGFRLRPRFDWRGTGLRKSVSAARWTLLFVLANLVASTVVTRLASAADAALPDDGVGYTAYSYAQQIWMLPQSIVTVSLITVLLPRMSRAATEHRLDDLRADLSRALRVSGVVIVPAAFFFAAFGPQIAQLLFAHGAANAATTVPLGHMLQAFGLGLIPFSAQYLLLRGFYAFEDTRTPFRMALWISGINIALAVACHLLLSTRWAVTGMAAAYALSYAIDLLLTALRLRRRTGGSAAPTPS